MGVLSRSVDPVMPEKDSARDARLVLRAQLGDRAALDTLLLRNQGWLKGYLTRLLGNSTEADDCHQDVLVIVVRKLALVAEPRWFRSWLYRVATREGLRRLRRTSRTRSLGEMEEAALPAADLPERLAEDERERLRTEVDALPPNSRAVVVLHYVEDMSLAEVADVLGIPIGTTKSRLAYGLARLRAALGTSGRKRR